jgi:hypothetical protein
LLDPTWPAESVFSILHAFKSRGEVCRHEPGREAL